MESRNHNPLERLGEDAREAEPDVPVSATVVFRTPQSDVMIPRVPRVILTCGTAEAHVKEVRPHRRLEHQEASGQA